jgi:spore maturation protein CgeB
VQHHLLAPEDVIYDTSVLYVQTGLWAYAPLDEGVIQALKGLVKHVHVAHPNDNVAEMAESLKPALVLALNSVQLFSTDQADTIRKLGIPTAVWFTDDPYYSDVTRHIAPHYSYVFTLDSSCIPLYQEVGCERVYYLPFGVNTGYYKPKPVDAEHRSDICFIGSAFWNRVAFFDEMADYLADKKVVIAGYWWDRLRNFKQLESKIRLGEWISPDETASYYHGASIVINLHRSIHDESNQNSLGIQAHCINPRTFEISACGTAQLTDIRENLPQMYTPGVEIDTFGSPQQLIDKIEYYLNHERERHELALRGLHRTFKEHTYRNRLMQLLNITLG